MKKEYYKVEGLPGSDYDILYYDEWDQAIDAITSYFADTIIGDQCDISFTTVMLTESDFEEICNGEY